jgi:hypothetical protein
VARFTHIRSNFLAGEVSPKMWGRTEMEQYTQMCEQLRNMIVYPQGGAGRRQGTQFVKDISSMGTSQVKVIPFNTTTYDYLVLISSTKIQTFCIDTGTLEDITLLGELSSGDEYVTDWTYGTELISKEFSVTQYGDVLVVASGARSPVMFTLTPKTLGFATDIGYLRFGRNSIIYSGAGLNVPGGTAAQSHRSMAWLDENVSTTTIAASATTGNITLTASTAFFTTDMVTSGGVKGTLIRLRSGSSVGVAEITGYTSGTVVNATVLKTLPATAATTNWSESAWSLRQGFPRTCQFHQQRLFWGGTTRSPDTIWASQIGDYIETSKADPTSAFVSSDALKLSFATNSLSTINFMSSGRNYLEIGTDQREVNLVPATQELAAAGIVYVANYESSDGSKYIQPVRVNNTLIFLDSFAQKTKEYSYDYREEAYKTNDLNYLSPDIFKTIVYGEHSVPLEMCYQKVENSIVWFNCVDSLVGLTRNKEYGIFAYHRHYLGGNKIVSSVDHVPIIDSFCNITSNGKDEVYMAVQRTINGSSALYLEKFSYEFDADTMDSYFDAKEFIQEFPVYMDCAVLIGTGDIGATTTWDCTALKGETVHYVADGFYMGTIAVPAGGTVTTPAEHTWAIFGFNYVADLVPIALQSNSLFGSGLGQIKRVEELTMIFNRTVHAKFGVLTNEDDLELINFRPAATPANTPTPLFTGEVVKKLTASYEGRQNIMIRSDLPLPMQLTALISKGILYD